MELPKLVMKQSKEGVSGQLVAYSTWWVKDSRFFHVMAPSTPNTSESSAPNWGKAKT